MEYIYTICCVLYLIILSQFVVISTKKLLPNERDHIKMLMTMTPIKYANDFVIFWRPQKVGSSTILSILISHAFRYNIIPKRHMMKNSFCIDIANCGAAKNISSNSISLKKTLSSAGRYAGLRKDVDRLLNRYSVNHVLCDFPAYYVQENLKCAFLINSKDTLDESSFNVYEIFAVRDPIDRMISIYYFWGELYRLGRSKTKKFRLGESTGNNDPQIETKFKNSLFEYHGNETSVPSRDIAAGFVDKFPLLRGMPGPSYTWSAFADNPKDAANILKSNRIMTLVTERLDESLVLLSHYMKWSLADVVVVAYRKSLSKHPKASVWPQDVISSLRKKLVSTGEYQVYEASVETLNNRIKDLKDSGVDFQAQLELLRELKRHTKSVCFEESSLEYYKKFTIDKGLPDHRSKNKLRDVDNKFSDDGHSFSFNGELLLSYDICNHCEAHLYLLVKEKKVSYHGDLSQLSLQTFEPTNLLKENLDFVNCPLRKID